MFQDTEWLRVGFNEEKAIDIENSEIWFEREERERKNKFFTFDSKEKYNIMEPLKSDS